MHTTLNIGQAQSQEKPEPKPSKVETRISKIDENIQKLAAERAQLESQQNEQQEAERKRRIEEAASIEREGLEAARVEYEAAEEAFNAALDALLEVSNRADAARDDYKKSVSAAHWRMGGTGATDAEKLALIPSPNFGPRKTAVRRIKDFNSDDLLTVLNRHQYELKPCRGSSRVLIVVQKSR